MISAFENGEDIHSATAAEVFAAPGKKPVMRIDEALRLSILDLFMACQLLV